MRIKFIKPATAVGFGYRENEVADLPPESATMLIEKGFAEEVKSKKPAGVETRESKAPRESRRRAKGKEK